MNNAIAVVQARYERDYTIWIEFTDGKSGIVDLADLLDKYPQAEPLKDRTVFSKFYLDGWPSLAWECGFDIAPESLYLRIGK